MSIIVKWIVIVLALLAIPYFVGGVTVTSFGVAVVAGAVLVFIDLIIKPIVKILTLPINIITLGLFSLVVNAIFFYFVGDIVSGFEVASFQAAFWGALIVSVVSWFAGKISHHND
ncbi:phage holin family protein [Candidatus Nomurabacteria bacterium]|nr:phage holin family protein [Candidatus Nomurabacteria bacterium]MCB9820609.1 phage holin family protein [Candidatus Nomurabacteria bacterium]